MSSKMHWLHWVSLWLAFYNFVLRKEPRALILYIVFNFAFRSSFKQNARYKYLFIISWNNYKLKLIHVALSSLCPLFFIKFLFFHQMIGLQKLWKMFFISSKKLFPFSRYSNFCNFFPSFPHIPDSKGQMEVE